MEIVWNLILFLLGLAALYYGAEFLVKGGCAIAEKAGISPLVIGLTLVACATSAPELVVSVRAALAGNADISLGSMIYYAASGLITSTPSSSAYAQIRPGDIIFGDMDGVLCIPREIAYDVLLRAEGIERNEVDIFSWVRQGDTISEIIDKGGYF